MISNEIFLMQNNAEARYYRTRRELAKAVLSGYLEPSAIVIRYERGPTSNQNDDLAPQLREFLAELPDFIMAKAETRKELTDAMENHINELLR